MYFGMAVWDVYLAATVDAVVEATARFAAELRYEVTVARDATADFSDAEMHAAVDRNLPQYASAIVTTNEVVDGISPLAAATSMR